MNENSGPLTSWTLAAIKARGLALEGYCQSEGYGHFYTFDLGKMIETAGADYIVPEILPGMVCAACGGRLKFMLASVPPEANDIPS